MRHALLALPLIALAVPAAAAPRAPIALPPELADPAMADRMGRVAGVLAKSLMNLPVGEIEAAVEGRPATSADRSRTVRDHIGDPQVEQRIAAQAANSGRMMQSASKALFASLPAIMSALAGIEAELERAVANIPDPTYPRR